MPVDSTHPQYDKFNKKHTKCRDAYEGEQTVKEKKTTYLPLLSGMKAGENKYKAYLERAMFYSATRRTVEGLAGVVDRKPPTIEIADGLPWKDNIDGNGMSLHGFANQIVNEAVLIDWQGILVDRRDGYEYPYPVQYLSEQIINRHYEGASLVMVMLKEEVHQMSGDYKVEVIEQWRELTIVDGVYTVLIHRKKKNAKKGEEFEVVFAEIPTMRGDSFGTIPFVFVSADNELKNPPLMDRVEVNFHHYKNRADFENGLHFTGVPTPWSAGVSIETDDDGNNKPIEIGSETCLLLGEGGTAGYMEFRGQGLKELAGAMDTKKQEMASLGARLLQNDKKAAEAAETARINKSGDSNVIASIVSGVERSLNTVLSIMSVWAATNPESNTIELNRDFIDEGLNAQTLTAIVVAVQGGTMSLENAVYLHKKNDMMPDDRSIEDELSAIKSAAPSLNGGVVDLDE